MSMPMPLSVEAREHGLVGDGTTNDRPALAKLVDALGAACAADGRPRTVRVPAGRYVIREAQLTGNHIWDDRRHRTQTHGLWITRDGSWTGGRVTGNDLGGNASSSTRCDHEPRGGRWRDNDTENDTENDTDT
jgi:hypothetical protein